MYVYMCVLIPCMHVIIVIMSLHSDGQPPSFEFSDYSMFDDLWVEDHDPIPSMDVLQPNIDHTTSAASSSHPPAIGDGANKERYAFKVKSEVEILDGGFKWRKYGKKMVKNSPNPKNYYKCSVESCPVKKRVERDKDDMRYVITTYQGVHSHFKSHQFCFSLYLPHK